MLRSDFIGNRDTIGGDMCNTKVLTYKHTLILIDNHSHMIILDAQKGPTAIIYHGVSPGEHDIRRLQFKVNRVGVVLILGEERVLSVTKGGGGWGQ